MEKYAQQALRTQFDIQFGRERGAEEEFDEE
jgi:hypothetical protein